MNSPVQPAVTPSADGAATHFGTEQAAFGTEKGGEPTGRFGIPARVWARVQVLFGALVLIKCLMLVGLRKHLYEIHWRVGEEDVTTLGTFAYYLFVALGIASLFLLGRRCRATGPRAIHALNAIVVGLGLLFVLLNFHAGDKKYLFPVMTGVLRWWNLGSYLSLDFFFRAPYLAGWIAGYALAYYGLARSGKAAWTFYLTVFCAGVFGGYYLRELAAYQNELLALDCVGIVSVIAAAWSRNQLRIGWMVVSAIWTVLFAMGLFYLAAPHETESLHYLLMLLGVATVAFAVATLAAGRAGLLGSWCGFLLFYFASFLLLLSALYPLAPNYNNAICFGLEAPRYFLGEFALAAGALVAGVAYCRWRPKGTLVWLDVLALGLIAMAFVDYRLTQIMGLRLDWELLRFADSPKMMWRMAKPYLPGVAGALAAGAAVYALGIRSLSRWNARPGCAGARPGWSGMAYAAASFVLLGAVGVFSALADKAEGQAAVQLVKSSPLWKRVAHRRLGHDEFCQTATALGLGGMLKPERPVYSRPPRDLNVVLVFLESSYNRHLSLFGGSEETQPLLSKYKNRMELFPNFFSNFAGSIQARFATFTSLYPVRDFTRFTRDRVPVKSIFEALHGQGYECSLFYSSYFDYTGFRDFLRNRGIDGLYDADTMPGERSGERISWGLKEEETLGAMRAQISRYATNGAKFFLTYVPAAPHYPYDCVPPAFRKYKIGTMNDYTPSYLNELLYIDSILAGIVDQLRDSGLLEKTLVVITDDHGEMTGENGSAIGHGWVLTPELANAPLIIMDPEKAGYRVNYRVGSQVDLLPTILDVLRIPLPAGQLYQGRSLYRAEAGNGALAYLNSYDQYGIMSGDQIVLGSRKAEESGAAAASARAAYTIANKGCKTTFNERGGAGRVPGVIRNFDNFQEAFLRDYDYYCESLSSPQFTSLRAGGK
jgi:hypothetical protein